MSQPKKTFKEWLSEVFGVNVPKIASENLTTEEYNSFEASGAKLQESLLELEQLRSSSEQLTATVKQLNEQLTEKSEQLKQLETKNQATESELQKYKALYAIDADQGNKPPKEDNSDSQNAMSLIQNKINALPVNHPDRLALESFLKKNNIKI